MNDLKACIVHVYVYVSIFLYVYIHVFRYKHIIYIYIYGHPPPLDRPRNCISDLSRKRGGGGKSTTPKFLEFSKIQKSKKTQPKFRIFGNSRNFGFFWILSKIPRVSKNPKLGLGFLDFWIFGNSRNFGFFWILSKFLEFPKIRNWGWDFWIFGILETRGILGFLDFEQIPRVSKNPKLGLGFLDFWIFGNSRNFGVFLDFEQIPRVSKNPKLGLGFLDFWKLEEFWVFLDFEQIPRVSKNPKLGLGFLDFWIFGNSGFGEILLGVTLMRNMKYIPKIRNLGWDFWIFGFLETQVLVRFF